ncbi:MAG TPA: SurA N-terminal domain-containing protein [Verrucomicrobiae bacterium]|nr:SurA N-terminal domain-containing protein [Verrucomicrobiae bacterium]
MFGTIRKHQSWLWFLIIGVTILGMVVWTNQTGTGNGQRGAGHFGSIDNKAITATEMQQAQNEAALMYLVRTHEWPDNAGARFNLERESYQRLFLLRKVAEYDIHVDADATAQLADLILRQFGQGQAVPMETFVDQVLKQKGMTAEDFQHFVEHDIAIQQLASVIGLSGKLVTPAEIQTLYVQEYQELAVDAVFFSASNNLAKVQAPTPEALGHFYTNQQAAYREPDQMQVSYVFFNVTNFMAQAEQQLGTNLNRTVDEAFTRIGTNISRLGKTPEEARAKVRELIVEETAISNANSKAVAFENEVIAKQPSHPSLEDLAAVAKEKGLEVKVTKPFEKEYGPGELDLGSSYPVASLFNLNADDQRFVESPIRGADGVYVVAFNKLIPSHIPSLQEIHSRVEADYKFSQALRIAQINGQVFAQTATNELAHGKTFAQTCDATRVTPIAVPPFSLSTERLPEVEDHVDDLNTFKGTAFGTPVGGVSHFVETHDGGFVVHVKQRLPVDQTKMAAQLPEFSNAVRQRRESEAFNIWFGQGYGAELNRGLRDFPSLRRQ